MLHVIGVVAAVEGHHHQASLVGRERILGHHQVRVQHPGFPGGRIDVEGRDAQLLRVRGHHRGLDVLGEVHQHGLLQLAVDELDHPHLEEDVRRAGREIHLVPDRRLERERRGIPLANDLVSVRIQDGDIRAFRARAHRRQILLAVGLQPFRAEVLPIGRHGTDFAGGAVEGVDIGIAGMVGQEVGDVLGVPGRNDRTAVQGSLHGGIGDHLVLAGGVVQVGDVREGPVDVLQDGQQAAAVIRAGGDLRPRHPEVRTVGADGLVLLGLEVQDVELVHVVVPHLVDAGHVEGLVLGVVETPAVDVRDVGEAGGLPRLRVHPVQVDLLVVPLVAHPVQEAVLLVPGRAPEILLGPVVGRDDVPLADVGALREVEHHQRARLVVAQIIQLRRVVGEIESPGGVRETGQEGFHVHFPVDESDLPVILLLRTGTEKECCR